MAIFPLRLSRPGLRLKTHHYIVIIATHLSVFSEHCHSWLSHDERSQIVRALPDILWTMQDLNLRSLPLSVKRRNPPRPMVHIYRHLDGMLRVVFRLSGGLFVVLTKALRPRLHRRCFVLPGRLLLFTACFAAWRARPPSPVYRVVFSLRHICPRRGVGAPSRGKEERR